MSKSMTKYQLDHFRDKVKRQFNPLIEDQELLVKQYKTQATDKAVAKLSKKIGADKIIKAFEDAEKRQEDLEFYRQILDLVADLKVNPNDEEFQS